MLTTLLTSDSIPHRMFPVEGYAELEERTQDLEADNEVSLDPSLLPSSPYLLQHALSSPLSPIFPFHLHRICLALSFTRSSSSPWDPSSQSPPTSSHASTQTSTFTSSIRLDLGIWRICLEEAWKGGRGCGFGETMMLGGERWRRRGGRSRLWR